MLNKLGSWWTVMQAGWIAARCKLCVIDDENEEIRACQIHEPRIAELERQNQRFNN